QPLENATSASVSHNKASNKKLSIVDSNCPYRCNATPDSPTTSSSISLYGFSNSVTSSATSGSGVTSSVTSIKRCSKCSTPQKPTSTSSRPTRAPCHPYCIIIVSISTTGLRSV